ncbi:MAG: methylenetetrahydrofolate reductase [NAD(P)H] [Chitinophagaceae bacterium]|nr:methylenetetrahydrofolate reductase [NAD(P)H] [Chitinophagaceae bacterium]HQU56165.1 methylenetetrahydrofolate reductase [NAD(P)H] [Chitinophagaceae bacterium]HQV05321.1 methylenetetrahydrofolate reductase [NAD(P)H] [Chitinophagaceae bacterium]
MKVIDHIKEANGTLISFEVLPPIKGKGIEALYNHLDPLMELHPSFINVTYHRSEHIFKKRADGSFEKVIIRKRPGTESICAAIMNRYKVDTVPHLICGGFDINETEDALINLRYLGIDNVLILRGDAAKNESAFEPEPGGHRYASDLLKQVVNLNAGVYLQDELKNSHKTDFCIGVAGYPEKHFEAPNMESDLNYLKEKIALGADYIVTQMFFDNAKYYAFVEKCRAIGINVPIIPGLKPVYTRKQLNNIPKTFHVDLPNELAKEMMKCKSDEEIEKLGSEWLLMQSKDLKKNGVPVLHYYTLSRPDIVGNIVKQL